MDSPLIHSVSQVLDLVQKNLEAHHSSLWLTGEVSNLKYYPSSGHTYLTLKDAEAQIRAVLFRGVRRQVSFQIEEGLSVLAYGRLNLYKPRGDLQIVIESIEPMGVGALQLAFEQLKKKLQQEGLFDPSQKKRPPFFPKGIGVITSSAGAALQDILHVLERRCPAIPIKVSPVTVQGESAPQEICEALQALNRRDDIDVILLARGGGSIEDLSAFNNERVARAIFGSRHPIITGIGHETDFTIADFVADCRAPTPSAAAEIAVPVQSEILQDLMNLEGRLSDNLRLVLDRTEKRVQLIKNLFEDPSSMLENFTLKLHSFSHSLCHDTQRRLDSSEARLQAMRLHLEGFNPIAILKKGYCIATPEGQTRPLKSSRDVSLGQALHLHLHQGQLKTQVTKKID